MPMDCLVAQEFALYVVVLYLESLRTLSMGTLEGSLLSRTKMSDTLVELREIVGPVVGFCSTNIGNTPPVSVSTTAAVPVESNVAHDGMNVSSGNHPPLPTASSIATDQQPYQQSSASSFLDHLKAAPFELLARLEAAPNELLATGTHSLKRGFSLP
ncbi:unnamed protein product [Bodo saltans]|uniref:Uncharacterized protein n=1 Tax=Bodo saltans TaxID=75058 RepID=A0A0S4JST0_BODSA|nr:unnamed protein product [Bodo saltans]|eukprot:CUG92155.1 unnamed protein product [Bodo saltans]